MVVALLAEGVDRNSRMVWRFLSWFVVALLAEGVDRNAVDFFWKGASARSPSSRRAWIEMKLLVNILPLYGVALLAEGVDRNVPDLFCSNHDVCRPPRGGRG